MENLETTDNNKLVVTNIKYNINNIIHNGCKTKDRPDTMEIDIPNTLREYNYNDVKFRDYIESFVYNFISRKFGIEVSFCQIWLPM